MSKRQPGSTEDFPYQITSELKCRINRRSKRDISDLVGEIMECVFCRPYGTNPSAASCPSSKLLGYCQLSLAGQREHKSKFATRRGISEVLDKYNISDRIHSRQSQCA